MIKDILGNLLTHLELSFEDVQVSEENGITRIDITSNQASKIIGWHGETLNSIQHMVKVIVRKHEKMDRSPFIVLDVDGYRRAQEQKVCSAAEQKADFVRRSKNRVALPPMSPYFRRVVHLYVANNPDMQDLTTFSTGEGEYRQIILCLKDKIAQETGEELSPTMEEETVEVEVDGLENLDI